jgi:uncharacterized protein YbaP (TraB family)
MIRTLAFFLVPLTGLWLALSAFWSGKTTPADVAPASSLLWKIEAPGVKHPSYLFGTMHLIQKDYFYFPESLKKIIKRSSVVVLELPGIPNQLEAMKYLVLEEGTFFDYFTPQQTDTILQWAQQKMGMSETLFRSAFSMFKPFVVIQTATQLQFMGQTESYELTMQSIAQENKVPIEGLETIADQMKIFDDLTKEQQAEMVLSSIRNEAETKAQTDQMQAIYKRQRIDSLYALIHEEGGVLADEQNAFLDQRNENWVPKIQAHVAKGKAFIAVGAGHLGGEKGLIRLLEKAGYKITPVEF